MKCCPSNLLSGSTPLPPLLCVNKYTVYTYHTVRGGGVWGSGPKTDKHLPQVPLHVNFLDDDILHCMSLIFLRCTYFQSTSCIQFNQIPYLSNPQILLTTQRSSLNIYSISAWYWSNICILCTVYRYYYILNYVTVNVQVTLLAFSE